MKNLRFGSHEIIFAARHEIKMECKVECGEMNVNKAALVGRQEIKMEYEIECKMECEIEMSANEAAITADRARRASHKSEKTEEKSANLFKVCPEEEL